jgi:archaemetzincin
MTASTSRNRWLLILSLTIAASGQSCAKAADMADAPPVAKTIRAPRGVRSFKRVGDADKLSSTIAVLKPIHSPLGRPNPGDWLDQHEESGQTFQEYLRGRPVTPTGNRTVIYVQPLGEFTAKQREIVELSAEYLGLYFCRPVKILATLPPSTIPNSARRTHPEWKVKQILSTYVLDQVLKPRLPKDAAAYIAFTTSDLWPGPGWNFVFGQASLRDRVGVWSITRNGDPAESDDGFRVCLRRTLKTATHETGHMFSIPHCIAYECNMSGSNHLAESDRHPLYLCPECHAKVCWATNAEPIARLRRLAEFCQRQGLQQELTYFIKATERLSGTLAEQP